MSWFEVVNSAIKSDVSRTVLVRCVKQTNCSICLSKMYRQVGALRKQVASHLLIRLTICFCILAQWLID